MAQLLEAGADPDVQDGESGWWVWAVLPAVAAVATHRLRQTTAALQRVAVVVAVCCRTSLHRALYLGNLRAAAVLLGVGAAMDVADPRGRLPLDLVSWQLARAPAAPAAVAGSSDDLQQRSAVWGWGSGSNYALGTGDTQLYAAPVRLEPLMQQQPQPTMRVVAAAKFHSAAIDSEGRLWTWGWGRGGRTGHADCRLHSGESAQIMPRPLAGLGKRQVVAVALAKHHTLAATSAGELYSW